MPDENGNLLPGDEGYIAPEETPVPAAESVETPEETIVDETPVEDTPTPEETETPADPVVETASPEYIADAPPADETPEPEETPETGDDEQDIETFEEKQASVRSYQNTTPRPDHENSSGYGFYQGSPEVNPDNELLQFGETNPNKENR